MPSPTAIVPRLSIMVLRVFEADVAAESQPELAACLREVAISSTLNFDLNDIKLFHAHWEVLARLVGWTGKMSLAKFYSRNYRRRKPMAKKCVVIDFCLKTDGLIEWRDKRSIFAPERPSALSRRCSKGLHRPIASYLQVCVQWNCQFLSSNKLHQNIIRTFCDFLLYVISSLEHATELN